MAGPAGLAVVFADEHEVAAGGEGLARGSHLRVCPVAHHLAFGDSVSRSGRLEVGPVATHLAASVFGCGQGPLFEQAGEGEQRVSREPRQKRGFVRLLYDRSVGLGLGRLIQALKQQTRLEIIESCGERESVRFLGLVGLHSVRWPKLRRGVWRACDEKANIAQT